VIVLDAAFELSAPTLDLAPPGDLPEFCFAGRSNVGKSSMLNVLVRRKQLARVSKTPGRTRLLNFFRVDLADHPGPQKSVRSVRLCDLPGYGYAEAPKAERRTWAAMIGRYLESREALKAVVVLVDGEIGPQPRDFEMMESLAGSPRPLVVCATKADRLPRTRRGAALDRIASQLGVPRGAVLPFSSVDVAIGRDALWDALCAAAGLFRRESGHVLEPATQAPEKTEESDEEAP
jgi:GTP-binding protein